MDRKIVTTNRKAFHDYTIIEKYVAGIVLTGTEIKSIRKSAINLKDSFCKIENNEIFLYKCHISPYEQGNRFNHDAERVRKLLLNKKEILKMHSKVKQDNYTIVPLEVFLSHGFAKVEIGLAKGKKVHDKRDDIAKKDQKREMERAAKMSTPILLGKAAPFTSHTIIVFLPLLSKHSVPPVTVFMQTEPPPTAPISLA